MQIYDLKLKNNIILGSSKYPSPKVFLKCVKNIKTEMITVALRKIGDKPEKFYKTLKQPYELQINKNRTHVLVSNSRIPLILNLSFKCQIP